MSVTLTRVAPADHAFTLQNADHTFTLETPAYVNYVAAMLADAVWYIDAASQSYSGGQTVPNLGSGGSALDATLGSTGGSDTNDPAWLDYTGTNYLWLPGVTGNLLSTPDSAALDIVGDIDIRAKASMTDWSPASTMALVAKENESSQRSYWLVLNTTGTLSLWWSTTGSDYPSATSTANLSGLANGATKWVRATLDVDNGAGGKTVSFYTSDDGTSWTALGTPVTTAGTTSIYASTTALGIGGYVGVGSGLPLAGSVYRAVIYSDLTETTKVLDVDTSVITDGSATTFTEQSGNAATVTINRSTSGRKAAAVTGKTWPFGTDDYMEVPDNALLDFGASDDFTILAVHRPWSTQGTNDVLVAKKANTTATTAGWSLTGGSSTALQGQGQIGDGTNGATAVSGSRTSGALSVTAAVRNVTADTITAYLNGTAGTPVTDATTATLANAEVMRVGRLSGAGTEYLDAEVYAAAVWRRALTAAEITALTTYFTTRG